jgi:arabinogalactan endo-1,4-beta-galactosidase
MDLLKSLGMNAIRVRVWVDPTEPECYVNWNSYPLGAFDNSGKPTIALNAFN